MIVDPTHLTIKPGKNIGLESFELTMETLDESSKSTFNKNTESVDMTGTYGFWPSWDPVIFIADAVWQTLVSFGGRMDVIAAFTDKIVISVNNPTFGYPYTVFVDGDSGQGGERYDYYVGESHTYVDSKGRSFTCTRNEDSDNKEFTIEACA